MMFHLIVTLTVRRTEDVAAVQDALTRMRPLCLAEPGCVSWDAYQDLGRPTRFTLVEAWEDEAAWRAHDAYEAIQTIYVPVITAACDRDVQPATRLASV